MNKKQKFEHENKGKDRMNRMLAIQRILDDAVVFTVGINPEGDVDIINVKNTFVHAEQKSSKKEAERVELELPSRPEYVG